MASPAQYKAYRFGSFALDLERGALLTIDGREAPLRPKSFALLQFLMENAGRLLTRDAIMQALWPNIYVTEDNVTQCIHDIRGALGAGSSQLLRTVPRRGYIFTPDVTAVPVAGRLSFSERYDNRSTGTDGADHHDTEPKEADGHAGRAKPATALWPRSRGQRRLSRFAVTLAPLRNLGVPRGHDYLVESIPEDISTDLLQYSGICVVGWPEAFRDDRETAAPRDVARGPGVSYIVQGSVRGIADRLAVNLQLVDAESGGLIWSERCDIDMGSSVDTRHEMTNRIALTLLLELSKDVNRRIEALPPEDWTVDDLLMRGMALLYRPWTAQMASDPNRQEALRCFEQGLARAPDSIRARNGIACVLIMNLADRQIPFDGPDEARAETLLADVIRTNGNSMNAHTLTGVLRRLQGRLHDAVIEFNLALKLAPAHSWTIANLAITLALLGQPDVAVPLLEHSIRLAPHDFYAPLTSSWLGLSHLLLGNTEHAVTLLRAARSMNPRISFIHLWLASALGLKGDLHEAAEALRQALDLNPNLPKVPLLVRRPNPDCADLFERTVYAGLRRAGLQSARWIDGC